MPSSSIVSAIIMQTSASAAIEALPTVSASNCMNWRKRPGPGTLPPVHAVRCRYGGQRLDGGGCRGLHDDRGYDGGARHSARQLHREGEQSESARRRDGGDRDRRGGGCGTAAHGIKGDR